MSSIYANELNRKVLSYPSRALVLSVILTILIGYNVLLSFTISNDILAYRNDRLSNLSPGRSGWTDTKESVASQGKLWTPEKVRTYNRSRRKSKNGHGEAEKHRLLSGPEGNQWVVVTTIFEPTKLIRQISDLSNWCLVVVGDKKTNDSIWYKYVNKYSEKVKYLSPSDQVQLPYKIISRIPWNHFGRKNIGYLYAIHHGAQVIWDTDDDNELKVPSLLNALAAGALDHHLRFFKIENNHHLWNPYPSFNSSPTCSGAKSVNIWPRGLPLPYIKDPFAHVTGNLSPVDNVAVFQSLADNDPDVDAIYRLSQPLPVEFSEFRNISQTIVLPPGRIAPFNAQATLWTKRSFWGLLLPITVHGRVSDIWRSYIAQRLMHEIGMHLSFTPPIVTQVRNVHSYLADLHAEMSLYTQTHEMVKWIYRWRASENVTTLKEALLELVINLFEITIVEESDVLLTKHWISDLESVGYEPPRLLKERQINLFNNFKPSTEETSNKVVNCPKP